MDAMGYIAANLFEAAVSMDRPKPGHLGNWTDYKQTNRMLPRR
jgi:hypothetical protein